MYKAKDAIEKHLSQRTNELFDLEDKIILYYRINLNVGEEYVVWNIYNTIREIENLFPSLKTDLDLRPIYHKNDDAAMANLHVGILAYWLGNTVRYQLKQNWVKSCWAEIVRFGNTQKVITTSGTNTYDKIITTRECTVPKDIFFSGEIKFSLKRLDNSTLFELE